MLPLKELVGTYMLCQRPRTLPSLQLLAWGWNARGTLGHGHRTTERKPRYVSELRGVRIVQVTTLWSPLHTPCTAPFWQY
jgi:alpha-tubulin suppressor-like RCC1 family protein